MLVKEALGCFKVNFSEVLLWSYWFKNYILKYLQNSIYFAQAAMYLWGGTTQLYHADLKIKPSPELMLNMRGFKKKYAQNKSLKSIKKKYAQNKSLKSIKNFQYLIHNHWVNALPRQNGFADGMFKVISHKKTKFFEWSDKNKPWSAWMMEWF